MNSFESAGFVKVEEFFDLPTISLVSEYFENKIARGEIDIVPQSSPAFDSTGIGYYADPLAEVLLKKATPFVSETVGEKVTPTYSFFRVYRPGEKLAKHTDRKSCEVSVTINIASTGAENKIHMHAPNGAEASFLLSPGDAVIYKGCEVEHWREPLEEGQLVVQFMLHYVKERGAHASFILDKRPRLGAKSCL
jgi:hypothetical protein